MSITKEELVQQIYYFDLGLLECNETKLIKKKRCEYNKTAREKKKLLMFKKIIGKSFTEM